MCVRMSAGADEVPGSFGLETVCMCLFLRDGKIEMGCISEAEGRCSCPALVRRSADVSPCFQSQYLVRETEVSE